MNQGKVCFVALMLTTLVGCSSFSKKDEDKARDKDDPKSSPVSLYELPDTIDLAKAARLNIELGLNYLKQEQVSRAKSKFLKAKALAPNLPEVHYSYGYFLEYVGETQSAQKEYQKAIALDPKSGNSHNNYGAFLCRTHQYREAEKEFMKAVSDPNYTNNAEAFENAGLCILQIKDMAKATEYFEKALRNDPNRPDSLLELAILRYQQQNMLEAKEYHKRFTQLSKPNARSLLLGVELAKNMHDKHSEAAYRMQLMSQYPNAKPADLYQGKVTI